MLFLIACTTSPELSDDSNKTSGETGTETGAETDSEPVESTPTEADRDGDSWEEGEDCDDLNPGIYPGATEDWDGLDNDCDGWVDADGDYEGTVRCSGGAVYEGQPWYFDLDCPVVATRLEGSLEAVVTCSPDPNDELAMLLLGESLTIEVFDEVVGDRYEGSAILASSLGWDTYADAELYWTSVRTATFSARLDAFSLNLQADGTMSRE